MYYLGVDGGGTKTAAVLADEEGRDIRAVKGGAGNIAVLDRGSVAQLIRSIISEILQGESIDQIAWGTFAFAGAGRTAEKSLVEAIVRGTGIRHLSVMTDAEILHYSIFRDEPGILLSAGTGSICLIRNHHSGYHQIGGWGYLLGDEGSGFYIGRSAIRAALRDREMGNPPSPLTQELLSFYGLDNPEKFITMIYSSVNPSNLIASCARLICELAETGESHALGIVEEATSALLDLAREAIRHFGNHPQREHRLCLTGGVLKNASIINQKFKERARAMGLKFRYLKPEMEPAAAGVIYSLKKAGKPVAEELVQKLKQIRFT